MTRYTLTYDRLTSCSTTGTGYGTNGSRRRRSSDCRVFALTARLNEADEPDGRCVRIQPPKGALVRQPRLNGTRARRWYSWPFLGCVRAADQVSGAELARSLRLPPRLTERLNIHSASFEFRKRIILSVVAALTSICAIQVRRTCAACGRCVSHDTRDGAVTVDGPSTSLRAAGFLARQRYAYVLFTRCFLSVEQREA